MIYFSDIRRAKEQKAPILTKGDFTELLSMVLLMLWWHFRQCTAESHLLTVFFTENQTCRLRLNSFRFQSSITYPTAPSYLHETEVALWEQMTGKGPCSKQKQTRSGKSGHCLLPDSGLKTLSNCFYKLYLL